MIFNNDQTIDGNIFMRDQFYTYIYDEKKSYKHMHIIYMSNFLVNIINNILHIYYSQSLLRNIKSLGLFNKEYKEYKEKSKILLKHLIDIPFLYCKSKNIIDIKFKI
jgi:hypothetical protein